MDWSKTPLGPRNRWPQSLRTTVNLCLASNFPIAIAWGPERTQLYNDGYWPICAGKHPGSMGQDFRRCWASAWPAIGGAFDQAAGGRTAFLVNERMFLDRDGYLEETFFTFSFSPIFDEHGSVSGLFHPVTELTQQTLAERRLNALRALLGCPTEGRTLGQAVAKATANLAPYKLDLPFVLVYLVDHEFECASLAGCTGLSSGGPASPSVIVLSAPAGCRWPVADVLRTGDAVEIACLEQAVGRLSCGPYFEPVQRAMVMPLSQSGMEKPLGVLVAGISTRRAFDDAYRTFLDMLAAGMGTVIADARAYELERRRAERLAEIDRAKTVFFSNVSHEFRTPLTLILGSVDQCLADPDGNRTQPDRERLEMAQRNATRLLKLVNTLLDFARIEAGRMQATFVPVDLAVFTAEVASMFSSAMDSAGIEFIVDCAPMPEAVFVDQNLWEKIVLNLISNAFKFTLDGRVEVRMRWEDGSAVLFVEDTGTGVAPEDAGRLFERFYRVPNARSRSFEGSGIGLALVHELVKLHGGTVDVASIPDRGTTFTVRIPGRTAQPPADRVGSSSPARPSGLAAMFIHEALGWLPEAGLTVPSSETDGAARSHERVLVVDDNADMRKYLYRILSPHWQVEMACDGVAGLEKIRCSPPDLVLADVMMPNLDGFGLVSALKADPLTEAIPIILLSARAGEDAQVEGLQTGSDDYLVKPFGTRELLARVRTHLDISRLRRRAVEIAQHDSLTGLPNRKLSYQFAERMLASARRAATGLAILFIDMDRFKQINDLYGHGVGDGVLKLVAQRLVHSLRAEDTVGRLGGDEFIVVLGHVNSASDAGHVARLLIERLEHVYPVDGYEIYSSPSIGISLFPGDGSDIDTLVKNADLAMYRAKERGRKSFYFFTDELNVSATRSSQIEHRLRDGLQGNEFRLHYQPIVDVTRATIIGAEALLRWPKTGIGPEEFIPIAESSGVIDQLGEWVLDEGCRQLREWSELGLPITTLSINVSPVQFRRKRLCDVIGRALDSHRIDPCSVQLELTESAVLKNVDEAIATMNSLRSLGLAIALDDFGKGYSSLGHLAQLPLDTVKIDQTFVRGLTFDQASVAITDAIVAIGRALALRIIGEGVETAETLALLRDKACPQMQGFYFCPPITASEFERWCRHGPYQPDDEVIRL